MILIIIIATDFVRKIICYRKLQNASKEKIDELMHHLQKKACSVLSTKIRSYIIGGDSNNMVDEPITEESTDALRRSPRLRKKNEFKHC